MLNLFAGLLLSCSTLPLAFAGPVSGGWEQGRLPLESIGELAFGPDDVLFVADPMGCAVYAIKINAGARAAEASFLIDGVDVEIASALGTTASDILIHDLAVHPTVGDIFLSVSRGRGEGSQPVLLRAEPGGAFTAVSLDDVSFSRRMLASPPAHRPKERRNPRTLSITDLVFSGGRLYVAGLSNEEFASQLRSFAFPFDQSEAETAIEIYHANHGSYETHAPVRTFLPYDIGGEPHLIAAYTCTPLVTFPLAELEPGTKVRGKTIAELGGGSRPLDMIAYERDGEGFILISNSRRGVMKVAANEIADTEGITGRVRGTAGVSYETIEDLAGVVQMAPAGDGFAVVLIEDPISKSVMLATVEMP